MAQPSDILSIKLQLGACTLPLDVRRDEEYYYREAAKLVSRKYNFYASKFPTETTDMFLSLTALDIAVSLMRKEKDTEMEETANALRRLLAEVETTLHNK